MKLQISPEVVSKYPDLRIGIVTAVGVTNNAYPSDLEARSREVLVNFSSRFAAPKDLEGHKNIVAWRDIYRSFGANPKKKTPTAEAFLSRVVRSGFVPHISPAVDSYLITEAIHCLPIGGYDLTKIQGDVVLRISPGKESFQGIGSAEVESTDPGEVVYADAARVLTRRWNYKDCDYAKITNETTRLALFVEGPISVIEDGEISATVEAISANLNKYCGAQTKTLLLGRGQTEIDLG